MPKETTHERRQRKGRTTAIHALLDDAALRDAAAQAAAVIANQDDGLQDQPAAPAGRGGRRRCSGPSPGVPETRHAARTAWAVTALEAQVREQEPEQDPTDTRSRGSAPEDNHGDRCAALADTAQPAQP